MRSRIDYVDGLRAIAVLLVFVTHATEIFSFGPIVGGKHLADLCYRLNLGRAGVVTFFAISGFVIPATLRGQRLVGSGRFVINRLFRLYPAFWVSLIPAALTFPLIWHYATGGERVLSVAELGANLTMLPALLGYPLANGAYWTLAIEILFYVSCLFLFAGELLGSTFLLATVSFFLFALFFSSQQAIFGGLLNPALDGGTFFLLLHLSIMFWGAVCRRWWDGERLEAIPAIMFWCFTAFWLVYEPIKAFAPGALGVAAESVDDRLIFGYAIGLGIFFVGLLLRQPGGRVIAWFGRISYAFYLLHGPVLYVFIWLTLNVRAFGGHRAELCLLVVFAACTALSALLFHGVEQPGIALGRRLAGRIVARPTAEPGPLRAYLK